MWIGPEDHKIVGEILEALRTGARVTQLELAQRLNKPQSFVSALESGQRRVDLLEFHCIVAALGGDPQSVFAAITEQSAGVVKRAVRRRRGR